VVADVEHGAGLALVALAAFEREAGVFTVELRAREQGVSA
jgi:hypothetical protein